MTFKLTVASDDTNNEPLTGVPIEQWGRDHWSTFLFFEDCCVNQNGRFHRAHLRIHMSRHPGLAHMPGSEAYPTRLKGHTAREPKVLKDHDDWDCAEDMEAAGLIEIHGTGIHPVIRMTEKGSKVAAALREHKTQGGMVANFVYEP